MAQTKVNDGGPAFPRQRLKHWSELSDSCYQGQPEYYPTSEGGMSLRDYFAAKAMQSVFQSFTSNTELAKRIAVVAESKDEFAWDVLSRQSYQIADAMLKARDGQ